jgi:hypothetical protein
MLPALVDMVDILCHPETTVAPGLIRRVGPKVISTPPLSGSDLWLDLERASLREVAHEVKRVIGPDDLHRLVDEVGPN